MKKNGFTLVELITTFAITAVIVVLLINVVVVIKELYSSTSIKTELYINQGNLSNAINSKLRNGETSLSYYEICNDSYFCYNFYFADGTHSKLSVTDTQISFDEFVYRLDNNTKVEDPSLRIIDSDDSDIETLVINIPIKNELYPDINFGINSVYFDMYYQGNFKKYYANGEVVYFDVKLGKSCTNYLTANSATGYKGIETPTETNNNCLKFYAFLDNEKSSTVNLILDHNTTALLAWNSRKSNLLGPSDTFLNQLKTDTNGWTGVTELTTNDTYTPSKMYNNGEPYTINYNGYRARIITAEEIAQITGNDSWTIGYTWFYFDSHTEQPSDTCKSGNTTGCKYGWLYDRTSKSCTTYGCYNNSTTTYGYWLVSAYSSTSSDAWYVAYSGSLYYDYVGDDNYSGLRPVIKVSKSKLS